VTGGVAAAGDEAGFGGAQAALSASVMVKSNASCWRFMDAFLE
jgi:hypothetical protein